MNAVLSPAEISSSKKMNLTGTVLIALAFSIPVIAIPLGLGSAFQAGEQSVKTLFALGFAMAVSWVFTRKRSEVAKANARVVVGLLLCVSVASTVWGQVREEQVAKDFMRRTLVFQEQQARTFTDLGVRFEKVNLAAILTPASLTTQYGMDAARAQVAQYRALLAERRLLLQTYLSEVERHITSLPEGTTRRAAVAPLEASKAQAAVQYAGLDLTQSALADSMEAVLNWAQGQAGKLGVRDGQLLFSTREQQAQLQGLLAKVQEAENAMNAEVASVQKTQSASQAKMQQNIEEMKNLLAK